jgi:hypothetical protein
MLGAWDRSMGMELPKNSCSGVGSAATSATNRRQAKRSSLELILSVILGVVPDVLETMPRVFTPEICARVCMGVCMTETKERTQEPTSRELLQLEQQSNPMSFASLPSLVLLKKFTTKAVLCMKRVIVVS